MLLFSKRCLPARMAGATDECAQAPVGVGGASEVFQSQPSTVSTSATTVHCEDSLMPNLCLIKHHGINTNHAASPILAA